MGPIILPTLLSVLVIGAGQRDVQQIQQSTGCNGDQIDIGKELAPFQLCRALQAGTGMGPEQHQLYNDKANQPFIDAADRAAISDSADGICRCKNWLVEGIGQ